MTELRIPNVGESITEVQLGAWLKEEGQPVRRDEPVVVVESDKATVELPSPADGRLSRILKRSGETVKVGEVIALLEDGAIAAESAPAPQAAGDGPEAPAARVPQTRREAGPAGPAPEPRVMPAARRELAARGLSPAEVPATGPGGRLLKEDVVRHDETRRPEAAPTPPAAARGAGDGRAEELVPMTRLRKTIAERLVAASRDAALLTTFNEIDMSAVQGLRAQHREAFQERHGVKLGIMSFFVRACVEALKQFPALNAEIRGDSILYRDYQDIGIAVGGGRGLVVPVLRDAHRMSFAEIEKTIGDFGRRAKENKLLPDELTGGTFTISNGGVYGSLLSTPLVNPPQSGVLGMHAIQERPVVRDGQIVARPMMYVALTYDHRLVDGREAVSFLVRVKEAVESPTRILLEI